MARIPESELERLKSEVSVQALVTGSGVALRATGRDWVGRCPLHEDGTASLVVTPAKNLWHCFGCGAAGGPVDWVIKTRGVSFRHAVELLREGLPSLAADVPGAVIKHATVPLLAAPVSREADDGVLLSQVADYYHASLKQSPEVLAYLEGRGLEGAVAAQAIEVFRLGYANRTLGLRLPDKNRKAGAEIRGRLERLGVYRESGHEHLNGSLVIPLFDEQGQVVNLYGRKITEGLRPGTPLHMYLSGPRRGLFNRAALAPGISDEIIVCEALIDALTFWCAGFRNVTSAYGVEGITPELMEALAASKAKRVLIAFDRDEAGERGAAKLAEKIQSLGLEAWRIVFPKGMDANEYAVKVRPAAKSLGLLIRKAEWLGKGSAPERREAVEARDPLPSLAAEAVMAGEPAAKEKTAPATTEAPAVQAPVLQKPLSSSPVNEALIDEALPAAAVPPSAAELAPAQVSEREVVLSFGEGELVRRWRVRGLPQNLAVGALKVNLMVSTVEGRFHVDTLDLYAARARGVFVAQAASELGQPEGVLKTDLGRVLLKLEAVQEEAASQALAPVAGPSMSELERSQALALLKSPQLLQTIVADFETCGVVGETTNKLVGYLAAVSRLLDRPLAVVIQSSSAAGKSSLMDAVLAFVPEEARTKYSAMTGQSLFYMGQTSLKHRILAIAEEEGASRASYAMKLLQSEGELTIASTGSDPKTGNLITQEYRVEGPTMLMMTTTAIDLDEELLNRCLVLTVDEDREQTRRIHALQREKRTLAGLTKREAKGEIQSKHQNAQRMLRALPVVNPYADGLTFLDDRTRTRRDHEKYLTLIDTLALLHQYQRPIRTVQVETAGGVKTVEYIEAQLEDIEQANALAHEVLGTSLDELPPQTRGVLRVLHGLVTELMVGLGVVRAEVRFTRAQVRGRTGLSDTQCRLHLERLVALEYVLVHRGQRGQSFVYELLHDGPLEEGQAHLAGLIDVHLLKSSAGTKESSRGERTGFTGSTRPGNGGDAGVVRGVQNGGKPEGVRVAEPRGFEGAKNASELDAALPVVAYMQMKAQGQAKVGGLPSLAATAS